MLAKHIVNLNALLLQYIDLRNLQTNLKPVILL